jgi:hypothetical protein
MFRPYMWAIFRLRFFNLQISYTRCVGRLSGRGTRSRCFNSGYRDPELLQVDLLGKKTRKSTLTTRGHGTNY